MPLNEQQAFSIRNSDCFHKAVNLTFGSRLNGFHSTVPNLVLPHWYLGRMQTKDLVYIWVGVPFCQAEKCRKELMGVNEVHSTEAELQSRWKLLSGEVIFNPPRASPPKAG